MSDTTNKVLGILLEEWDCHLPDLQLNITLNPGLNKILRCMERAYLLGSNNSTINKEITISSTRVLITSPIPLSEEWDELTKATIPIRNHCGKAIGHMDNLEWGENSTLYGQATLDHSLPLGVWESIEFVHSGVIEMEKGIRVLKKTHDFILKTKKDL